MPAIPNRQRVEKALELLRAGFGPYVEREMERALGSNWWEQTQGGLPGMGGGRQVAQRTLNIQTLDVSALLNLALDNWSEVFASKLSASERSLLHELRKARNRWAHQEAFNTDQTYRVLDDVSRLLAEVSAADQITEIEREKQDLLRVRFEEQARRETRKVATTATEGQPASGYRPWRDVVTPHPDVASGRYQQAEFAADLAQVHAGRGADEYRVPRDFFQRTYLTEGLRHLLVNALRRLAQNTGDPVVSLQTNFGGGKTHSMLALYHLVTAESMNDLPGLEQVFQEVGATTPPSAKHAVLVGTALSPAQPRVKSGGEEVRTLWGEMAWQLGGADGYAFVADADRQGVNPGSNALVDLFTYCSPCLVLIDEWVAFARQLYGVSGLPAGSFEANLTFAQALTEAAKAAPNTLVVASIPSSDIEVGGEAGREALRILENTFGRVESPWRPASAEEGFEIVRRRLFEPVADYRARDAVVRGFSELYRSQTAEFPSPCREGDYERRMQAAYPIHPELFDRLYEDWSSLDRFQRTRGVLRLMAAVIHSLWQREDRSLLILPAMIPIDDQIVRDELTRYLEDGWAPVIEKDVDGPNSLPLRVDGENPNFGRYSAGRRVARTVYMGSAPVQAAANKGIDDRQVKLGCAQPGESVATFGDALRRLTDQATYLYVNNGRYWYSLQPSVTRIAHDRGEQYDIHALREEIIRRLRQPDVISQRGDFMKVHPCPGSGAEVPDDPDARLVILSPEFGHASKDAASSARKAAAAILDQRGSGPRTHKNALVFLAADQRNLSALESSVRQYLAWKSIDAERETLNLDAFQANQARSKHAEWDGTVKLRIAETYQWVLAPTQRDRLGSFEWEDLRVQGDDALAVRASRKLRNEELLITQLSGVRLRMELDAVPLWPTDGDHVGVKQLWDLFSQYVYLPRLQNADVLLQAIRDGVARLTWESETFAYAEAWDASKERYLGLRAGQGGSIIMDGRSLVVKPDAARRQLDADAQAHSGNGTLPPTVANDKSTIVESPTGPEASTTPIRTLPRRFHGSVQLDPLRPARQVDEIAQAVIQHLTGLVGADAEILLEIEVRVPSGVPDNAVRTVIENSRVLKFNSAEFEES